jgi:hypothetical protein
MDIPHGFSRTAHPFDSCNESETGVRGAESDAGSQRPRPVAVSQPTGSAGQVFRVVLGSVFLGLAAIIAIGSTYLGGLAGY